MSSLEIGTDEDPRHFHEELGDNVGTRLNWLRAAVLGANDGIVSTAGVVMGVAGATDDSGAIVKASMDAQAACHGLVRLSGSMPNSMSA